MDLMARMTKTFDAFTQYQTRLVVIVDGLDTCEQGKVIQMLDMVRKSFVLSIVDDQICKHFYIAVSWR